MKLYQITAEMQALLDQFTDDADELDLVAASDRLDELELDFEQKLLQLGAVYKTLKAQQNACYLAATAIHKRTTRYGKSAEWIKQYMADAIKAKGGIGKSISSPEVVLRYYKDRDEYVHIDDGAIVPPEYCTTKDPEPSKTLLREAIEQGVKIDGVALVKKDRVEIK